MLVELVIEEGKRNLFSLVGSLYFLGKQRLPFGAAITLKVDDIFLENESR